MNIGPIELLIIVLLCCPSVLAAIIALGLAIVAYAKWKGDNQS